MKQWIVEITKQDLNSLGQVRCVPGIEVAQRDETIWIRSTIATPEIPLQIMTVPIVKKWTMGDNGLLFPYGASTPVAILPEMVWEPISSFVKVELPASIMPGKSNSQTLKIKLARVEQSRHSAAIVTTLDEWKRYGETVSRIRLASLQFAVSSKRMVLIIGNPLPSIPGMEYWLIEGMLLPAGFDFEWSGVAKSISSIHKSRHGNDIAMFHANGTHENISQNSFVQATRTAIRLTASTASDG